MDKSIDPRVTRDRLAQSKGPESPVVLNGSKPCSAGALPPHNPSRRGRGAGRAWLGPIAIATCALALCPVPTAAQANPDARAQLSQRVEQALQRAALGERIGVSILDLRTQRELVAHNASTPLRPASNMKLVTAAACLAELGPEFRIPTGLYGRIKGDAVPDGLYLKGFGDPTLRVPDLFGLAQQLFARGVRKVSHVAVDGSHFDDQALPPGFEEQPREYAPFRAAVAAVSVEENAYSLQVEAGTQAGASAKVVALPAAHFAIDNQVTTSARGPARVVLEQSARGDQLAIAISGNVPLGMGPVSYRRRIEAPLAYAGASMVDALAAAGITVQGGVRIAHMPNGLPLLAVRQSPSLAQMLSMVGKYSDNFVAEMLLKVLGAERAGEPGSSPHGASAALKGLEQRFGLPANEVHMLNGSGLFGDSRVSAGYFTHLLAAMHGDPGLRPEFLSQLAIGGVDGTLTQRLASLARPRIVRAKTGTLDDVIALSGYVSGRTPEDVIAFSLLFNGVRGKQAVARALADQIVAEIGNALWSGQVTAAAGHMPVPSGQLPAPEGRSAAQHP